MIFVTVGTHEQPFDRLIRAVDHLKKEGTITENVFIQSGYSDYSPVYCDWEKMIRHAQMQEKIREARLVITHGGPASVMDVIVAGKSPIVVPRQVAYGEHVDNHQVNFCRFMKEKGYDISLVEEMNDLAQHLGDRPSLGENKSNNRHFNLALKEILTQLVQM